MTKNHSTNYKVEDLLAQITALKKVIKEQDKKIKKLVKKLRVISQTALSK